MEKGEIVARVSKYSEAERQERRNAAKRAWHERNPEYKKDWEQTNSNKMRAYKHKWLKHNPNARKSAVLKTRYGITLAERDAMLWRQFGCGICGSIDPGTVKGWQVDHCHKTKVVRGVLCLRCNNLLGVAKDDVETLQAAISYLKASRK